MATDLEVALGEKLALAEHRYQRLVEEVKQLKLAHAADHRLREFYSTMEYVSGISSSDSQE
tara:strand:+ start:509 stop:691 length:183 start_codon:yes stop_codon:yes gene_type:complete